MRKAIWLVGCFTVYGDFEPLCDSESKDIEAYLNAADARKERDNLNAETEGGYVVRSATMSIPSFTLYPRDRTDSIKITAIENGNSPTPRTVILKTKGYNP